MDELCRINKANLYRRLNVVNSDKRSTIVINGTLESINLSSNDYLGLSRNKAVLRASFKNICQISQCSSRLIAGNSDELDLLEKKLADHRKSDRTLIYPSGYMANLGVISALADKSTTIYSDEYNHASIIDGCRLSGARIVVYRHNDLDHLDQIVRKCTSDRKILITETIFSMDGDHSDLKGFQDIARRHNAVSVVDDSHGDFIYNDRGKSALEGINSVDVYISSLSKALGCFGGYVSASEQVIELLINKSRSLIYSTSLPSHLCSAALAAIPIAKQGDLQDKLMKRVAYFSSRIDNMGFGNATIKPRFRSQIIPLMVGSEKKTVEFSKFLLSEGIFIHSIRYPTVRMGKARLRASITTSLGTKQLKIALEKIGTIARKLNII